MLQTSVRLDAPRTRGSGGGMTGFGNPALQHSASHAGSGGRLETSGVSSGPANGTKGNGADWKSQMDTFMSKTKSSSDDMLSKARKAGVEG